MSFEIIITYFIIGLFAWVAPLLASYHLVFKKVFKDKAFAKIVSSVIFACVVLLIVGYIFG